MRHTPLGYRMNRGKIIVVNKFADTVCWIFDSYVNGVSQKSIARQLSDKHIPTPTGKHKWSQCSVRSILTNRKYIGDDYHPRIIDPYIYERAQARREEKNKAVNSHPQTPKNQPLSGKCRCGKCGGIYRYVKGNWRCGNYIKNNLVSCDNDIYKDENLLESVIDVFEYLKKNVEIVSAEPEVIEKKTSIEVNMLKAKMRKAKKEENLSYKEFRELAYQKAQERYKVLPIWDRDYQNEKLQNYLQIADISLDKIQEIKSFIKEIILFPKGRIIFTLCNDMSFEYSMVVKI